MFAFRKLTARRRDPAGAQDEIRTSDGYRPDPEAYVLDSVPEEIFATATDTAPPADRSWMDAVPIADAAPRMAVGPARTRPARRVADIGETAPATDPDPRAGPGERVLRAANPEPSGRPRFPHGWLVVVEGPGLGEWFPLERGVSHVGRAAGQTVRLDFGDAAIAATRHAALVYDEACHAFVLDNAPEAAVRLNGLPARPRARLRDGDVVSLGGTSLRLVALCSPNFHWTEAMRAG